MKKIADYLNTQADEKTLKALGKDVKEELDTLSDKELKDVIVGALESMSDAAERLAQNPAYQDLARRLNDVTQGKKDVDKYQKAKIVYARRRLREMGKLGDFERIGLEPALMTAKRELLGARAARKDRPAPRCPECNIELREIEQKDGPPSKFECYRCETLPAFHSGTVTPAKAS